MARAVAQQRVDGDAHGGARPRAWKGEVFALEALRVHFLEGRALSYEDNLTLAAERAGLDPGCALAASFDPSVKDRLRANTDAAVRSGVFGVPTLRVGDAIYWGDDQIEEAFDGRAIRAASSPPAEV